MKSTNKKAKAGAELKSLCRGIWLLVVLSNVGPAQGQYTYTTNNQAITITRYTGGDANVVIPSTIFGLPVTGIGDYAFSVGPSLTGVTIPYGVTSIGTGAFMGCGFTDVAIPASVTNIGNFAFQLTTLTNIAVDRQNPAYSSLGGVLFDKQQATLIQYPGGLAGDYTMPGSVVAIGEGAFYECFGLTGITIPDSVTYIGDLAFLNCTNLTNATIGNGVSVVDGAAFSGCVGLTNLTIGSRVTRLGDSAFYNCAGLTSVTIPASVTAIGQQTFNLCFNLTSLYFEGNAPSVGSLAFAATPATAYYLPGTLGWGFAFGDIPTAPWTLPYPVILTGNGIFGVESNQFGFTVSWAANLSVVVEATTDLARPNWIPLETNSITTGSFNFGDPFRTNFPARFYRVRSL